MKMNNTSYSIAFVIIEKVYSLSAKGISREAKETSRKESYSRRGK